MKNPQQPPIVFWAIWLSICSLLFVYQFAFAKGFPSGEDVGSPNVWSVALSVGVVVFSALLRWLVLPRLWDSMRILLVMIAGLALAESAQLFQIFLIGPDYPTTQLSLFVLSLIGVVQFVPTYANRKIRPEGVRTLRYLGRSDG